MGSVFHVGFGVLLLLSVVVLIAIGIAQPDLFDMIIEKLQRIAEAIYPSIIDSFV